MSKINVYATSDTHGLAVPEIPMDANVVIHCGDLTGASPKNFKRHFEQTKTTINSIYEQCLDKDVKEVFLNVGNHDVLFDLSQTRLRQNKYKNKELVKYLNEIKKKFKDIGIKFHYAATHLDSFGMSAVKTSYKIIESDLLGTVLMVPFTNPVNTPAMWANHWPMFGYDENNEVDFKRDFVMDSILNHFDETGEKCNVIISHAPAKGVLDFLVNGENVGDENMLKLVEFLKPNLFVSGHIHEASGFMRLGHTTGGHTSFYNVAHLDRSYEVNNPFIKLEKGMKDVENNNN